MSRCLLPLHKLMILLYNLMNKLKAVLSDVAKLANNRYRIATVLATVVGVKVPLINAKAIAPDDYTLTLWAVCVFQWVTRHISYVCVVQALLLCYFIMSFKRLNRCVAKIHHFVVRVEPQKMNWGIRPKLVMHKSA